jgi:hypothetical protein
MQKILAVLSVAAFSACAAFGQASRSGARSCDSLAQLALPNAKVTAAQEVAAGAFAPPPASEMGPPRGGAAFYATLPKFCRVSITGTPSADSDIKIEVWMPATGWNGKLHGEGNGGFAGEIDYHSMGIELAQGYATAGTDTGHSASVPGASWATGHPEKLIDYGYRGIHQMTQLAKATIEAFYGNNAQRSYFASCSNGGREALMEAQRFPADYDGIIAGAPANFWTHLLTNAIANAQATTSDPASYIPASKLPAIAQAVNAACDAKDGVTDGVLNDPRRCHFEPVTLLCKVSDSDNCLTAPQLAALKKLYAGARDSHGREIFPGYLPGAEDGAGGWAPWITGTAPGKSLLFFFGVGYFSSIVYEKADWNYKDVSLDEALKAADEKTARILNSADPNLAPFKAHGGKLILYHGWNDAAISALNSINYYDSVVAKMGLRDTESFVRLYMVPGMQHCGGGPGATSFVQRHADAPNDAQHSAQEAIEEWVEKGVAPSTIIATKYVSDDPSKGVKMTRPLCPYPLAAKYKGTGDTNDAANFVCAAESK